VLVVRQLIPPLTARTPQGRTVQAWDYKQKKNLVIVVLGAGSRAQEDFLHRLIARANALVEREAVALVVFSEPPPATLDGLPASVVVGSDVSGRTARAYLGEEAFSPRRGGCAGVFVADRYGMLYAQWVGGEEALPGIEELLGWLSQIQIVCEECGFAE